jgi:oligoribonuclease NrnB/cAMP/cGMP phosphodiesterase (DHH superfamily)
MPRKSNKQAKGQLDNLNQTHGKIEKPLTLNQVWGDDGKSKYGTLDAEKYSDYLNDLNKSDLQAHAVKIGLVPIDDRNSLVTRLKKEFNKHVSQYSARTLPTKKDISKAAKDILSEGR